MTTDSNALYEHEVGGFRCPECGVLVPYNAPPHAHGGRAYQLLTTPGGTMTVGRMYEGRQDGWALKEFLLAPTTGEELEAEYEEEARRCG